MELNNNNTKFKKSVLNPFSFFSFSASIIMTMLLFSSFASSGFNAIFFLIVGAFLWFIPISLIASHFGSILSWENGGIFVWVKNSLGERMGFISTFFQWFQSTIIYTILFYFLIGGIDSLFDTDIFNTNILYKFLLIIAMFSIITLFQLFGIKFIAIISKLSLIIGVLIPSLLLIIFSFSFVFGTTISEIPPNLNQNFLPSNGISSIVVFSSFILGYTGIEESASNIKSLKNSKKNYPIIILFVVVSMVILNIMSSLSISLILPPDQISLSNGVYQTFYLIISKWFGPNFIWIYKIIIVLIIFGIIGQISSILSGPSRAIVNSLKYLNAPSFLLKKNKKDSYFVILFIQWIFMIFWLSIITFLSSKNNVAFTTCISITSVVYLLGYLLMCIGYLKTVWQKNKLESSFFIKNKYLKTIIGVVGLLTTLSIIIIVFFNPGGILYAEYITYVTILSVSIIFIIILAFLFYYFLDRHRKKLNINNSVNF